MRTALVFPETGDDATIRHLKRPALLFEKIGILHFSGLTAILEKLNSDTSLQLKAELEWLLNQGIVIRVSCEFLVDPFQEAAEHFPKIAADAMDYASAISEDQIGMVRFSKLIGEDGVLVCARPPRLLQALQSPSGTRTFTGYLPDPTVRQDVMDVVLASFPEPDEATPWEQIVEFRSDPDTRTQLLALRRWMSRVAQQDLSATEIADEIEWLVSEYQAHMRLHRMKITMGAVETVVTATAEALENVTKLRFGAVAKSVFFLKHRTIQLIEAERQAPGRELAYIIRARDHFGKAVPE